MSVTAVIGDVHGCIRTLDKLINSVEKKFSDVQYLSLGDLVDRGPGICDVLNLFMEMSESGRLKLLRGNHEDVFLDFAAGTHEYNHLNWLTFGGRETLQCLSGKSSVTADMIFNEDFIQYMKPYIPFLESAEFKTGMEYQENMFMFSHAGIGPSLGQSHRVFEYSSRQDYLFMWSRDTWRSTKKYFGYTMVHGHTPVSTMDIPHDPNRPFVNRNKRGELVSIAIDTGCVYGYSLTAMVIDESGQFDFVIERNAE